MHGCRRSSEDGKAVRRGPLEEDDRATRRGPLEEGVSGDAHPDPYMHEDPYVVRPLFALAVHCFALLLALVGSLSAFAVHCFVLLLALVHPVSALAVHCFALLLARTDSAQTGWQCWSRKCPLLGLLQPVVAQRWHSGGTAVAQRWHSRPQS